jgi:hypothetical protein
MPPGHFAQIVPRRLRAPAAVQGIEKTSIQCPSLPDSGSQSVLVSRGSAAALGNILGNIFPAPCDKSASIKKIETKSGGLLIRTISRRSRLGDILNYYERIAA